MSISKVALSLMCLLPIAASGQASSFTVSCPAEVPASAVQIKAIQPGWVPFVDQPFVLKGAGAAWGPPEAHGLLVGERSEKSKTASLFKFDKVAEGNWIQCIYGDGPEITLAKRLPDDVLEYTIDNPAAPKAAPAKVRITCKK